MEIIFIKDHPTRNIRAGFTAPCEIDRWIVDGDGYQCYSTLSSPKGRFFISGRDLKIFEFVRFTSLVSAEYFLKTYGETRITAEQLYHSVPIEEPILSSEEEEEDIDGSDDE